MVSLALGALCSLYIADDSWNIRPETLDGPWWHAALFILFLTILLSVWLCSFPIVLDIYPGDAITIAVCVFPLLICAVSLYKATDYVLAFVFRDMGWAFFKGATVVFYLIIMLIVCIIAFVVSTIYTLKSEIRREGLEIYCEHEGSTSFSTKLKYAWLIVPKVKRELRRREKIRNAEEKAKAKAKEEEERRKRIYVASPAGHTPPKEKRTDVYVQRPDTGEKKVAASAPSPATNEKKPSVYVQRPGTNPANSAPSGKGMKDAPGKSANDGKAGSGSSIYYTRKPNDSSK